MEVDEWSSSLYSKVSPSSEYSTGLSANFFHKLLRYERCDGHGDSGAVVEEKEFVMYFFMSIIGLLLHALMQRCELVGGAQVGVADCTMKALYYESN